MCLVIDLVLRLIASQKEPGQKVKKTASSWCVLGSEATYCVLFEQFYSYICMHQYQHHNQHQYQTTPNKTNINTTLVRVQAPRSKQGAAYASDLTHPVQTHRITKKPSGNFDTIHAHDIGRCQCTLPYLLDPARSYCSTQFAGLSATVKISAPA